MRLFIGRVGNPDVFVAKLKVGEMVSHACFVCTRVKRDRLVIRLPDKDVSVAITKPKGYGAGDELRFTVDNVAWRVSLTRHLQKSEVTYTVDTWRSKRCQSFD